MQRLLILKEDQFYYKDLQPGITVDKTLFKPVKGVLIEYLRIDHRVTTAKSPLVVSVIFNAPRLGEIYRMSIDMLYTPHITVFWRQGVMLSPRESMNVPIVNTER